ncbi:hypothetical protein RUM44_002386 [Polyplax serrata]|uniref:Neutral ceramidase n=1 Tax=Polyplax serrata TaxID=468196 RepID=A0ABR1AEL7_POLSC
MDTCKVLVLFLVAVACEVTRGYRVGVGRTDVTGPIAEITLMGYGKFEQKGSGLHTRQYARTYIIQDDTNSLVFVNVDVGMMADGVRIQVLKQIQSKFNGTYHADNVMISGTHTHSAPGGFMMHTFFDIPSGGFCKQTFDALVSGIAKSIEAAHMNLQEGRLYVATTNVLGITVNRSPTSYLKNPLKERQKYAHDTDKELVQLQFVAQDGTPLGAINWFPIHGTSLNKSNTLVSSDNVGYASLVLENYADRETMQGQSDFVGSFASSNLGDVSPNIKGPKCHQSGTECDAGSKCSDMFEECYAMGPGDDMFESVALIGLKLGSQAWDLIKSKSGVEVTGPVQSIHQYVDMSIARAVFFNKVTGKFESLRGCKPAMGYSAGAGTTDGQYLPFLRQGMTEYTWWVDAVTNVLAKPTREEIRCHAPKPILLASSHLKFPFDWQPQVVSTQLGRIGNVAIACVPGEFTTMSGRRMREAVADIMGENTTVVIAGLCNTYSDYIATYEEYQDQRYEAASTLYGPHTLNLHLHQYQKLATALMENKTLSRGPKPRGLDSNKMGSLIPPVIFDAPKKSHKFGDVLVQPKDVILGTGDNIARATFVGANPRNNLRLDDTFFLVETLSADGKWTAIASDADFSTKMHWRRTNVVEGTSEVDLEWDPSNFDCDSKQFRFRYFGDYKSLRGNIHGFEGISRPFTVKWAGDVMSS